MLIRLVKISLVASLGLFLLIVVSNNLTAYGSNFAYVLPVLAMDTTFPGNAPMWRVIDREPVYHAFYASIILWEAAACGLIFAGARKIWGGRGADAAAFSRVEGLSVAGLAPNPPQRPVAFIAVAGERFLERQSKAWNGREAAPRMFMIAGILLLFLKTRDEELPA